MLRFPLFVPFESRHSQNIVYDTPYLSKTSSSLGRVVSTSTYLAAFFSNSFALGIDRIHFLIIPIVNINI